MAMTNQGEVKCWGQNSNGQLGDGSTTQSSTMVSVIDLLPQNILSAVYLPIIRQSTK